MAAKKATKKRTTKKHATKKRATKKRATKKHATKKHATKRRATKRRASKRRAGRAGGVARAHASAHVKSRETWRRAVREVAGASANTAIIVVPGSSASPRLEGEVSHYRTRGGRRIDHPSAYAKKGRSNMVYHASTRHVTVGDRWSP
jgi:hypothetical protein